MRHITSVPVHIVYRLRGSLPVMEIDRLQQGYRRSIAALEKLYRPPGTLPEGIDHYNYQREKCLADTVYFREYDRLLDTGKFGPRFLADPQLKSIVLESWATVQRQGKLIVHAVSVMSNHVHVVVAAPGPQPVVLDRFMAAHKRFTAGRINDHRGARGTRVFAEFQYARTIRPQVLEHVIRYVINNPVVAGLTKEPVNWCGNFMLAEYYELFKGRAA